MNSPVVQCLTMNANTLIPQSSASRHHPRQRTLVLIRRDREPSKGRWTFPGGAVELGETVHDAVRREALEETGLQVEVGDLIAIVDRILHDNAGRIQYHYVILDFLAKPVSGALRPATMPTTSDGSVCPSSTIWT